MIAVTAEPLWLAWRGGCGMSPQQSCRMVSVHARTASNQILNGSVCYAKRNDASNYPDIELNKGNWYSPPEDQSRNWIMRHRPKLTGTTPNKPLCYRLLVPKCLDPSVSYLSTLNKYNLRNRSLSSKSRERSIRQGGRMGDE